MLGSRGLSQVGMSLDWDQERGRVKENRLHGVILFICLQHALVEAGRIFGLYWRQKISSNSRLLYGSQH